MRLAGKAGLGSMGVCVEGAGETWAKLQAQR